jgi:competence CoiA-like predicted nuclease
MDYKGKQSKWIIGGNALSTNHIEIYFQSLDHLQCVVNYSSHQEYKKNHNIYKLFVYMNSQVYVFFLI